jgi:glutathione synthase/RimK-type ligase-like ATP-grasp enzyme
MSRARIAIATCAAYEDLKADDRLLREALAAQGIEAPAVAWDDEGADWGSFDACLVRSTWDYHDKHEDFLAWTRRVTVATPLWNPAETIAWNIDKTYLRELGEAGVPIVPTVWLGRGTDADLDAILTERGWGEAVVKPSVDLGAHNLSRVRSGGDDGQTALENVLARHDAMVQPFLPSLEANGELSLIYIEGQFTHAVRKRPAPGDFRVQGIWGGTATAEKPSPEELEIGARTIQPLEATPLYARVDLVSDLSGKPCLIELELIEPNLYLTESPATAAVLAQAVARRLDL